MARGGLPFFTSISQPQTRVRARARGHLTTSTDRKHDYLLGNMSEDKSSEDLEVYLKDHYAGAVGALELLDHLGKAHADDQLGPFFRELHSDVKADHEQLHNLMTALGFEESSVRNAGAWMAEKIGRAKLGFSASEDAKLRLLQSLETLFLGITGKQILWRALRAVKDASPILEQTDFDHLEKRALEQLDRVEVQRIEAARAAFRAA